MRHIVLNQRIPPRFVEAGLWCLLAPVVVCAQTAVSVGSISKWTEPAIIVRASGRTDKIQPTVPIDLGDTLRTLLYGRIRAQLSDGSILSLQGDTVLKLEEKRWTLDRGTVRINAASPVEVRTSIAICKATGGDLLIDNSTPGRTKVLGGRGVEVTSMDGSGVVRRDGQSIVVEAPVVSIKKDDKGAL